MTCPHAWTVTSECPKCLRAEVDRLTLALAEAVKIEHATRALLYYRHDFWTVAQEALGWLPYEYDRLVEITPASKHVPLSVSPKG